MGGCIWSSASSLPLRPGEPLGDKIEFAPLEDPARVESLSEVIGVTVPDAGLLKDPLLEENSVLKGGSGYTYNT